MNVLYIRNNTIKRICRRVENMAKIYNTKTICYTLVLVLSVFLMSLSIDGYAESTDHPNMFLNTNEIEDIKEKIRNNQEPWRRAYDDMIRDDSKWLNMPIQSITYGGELPPSGDTHDYYTGRPYISDGVTDLGADRGDYNSALNMSRAVRYLGIAYAFTGNNVYAEKAIQLINGWTVDPSTRMNPTFTNDQSRIEISMSIPGMFYGADLIWNYPGWRQEDKDAFKEWTAQMISSAKTWSKNNNYENWRLVFISSASVITEDADSRQYAFDTWKNIIPSQMNTDGSMKQEITRVNSLTYSTFAVNAMAQTAEIARHYGVDLYNYKLADGRGLEKALDFHVPYSINPSDWPYQRSATYRGDNAAIYELAYSFKQKSSYMDVINKWHRPMFEMRVMGPITLTHASAYFNTTEPGPTQTRPRPTITPGHGTTPYGRLKAIIRCYVIRANGNIDNCY